MQWNNADLLRAGAGATPNREHSEPLYLTSSFTYHSAAQAAEYFAAQGADYIYSRFSNPTVATLNKRIALIEGAPAALSTASGMAALLAVIMGTCRQGARVLCAANVFGATVQLLSAQLAKFGISTRYVYSSDISEWRAAAKEAAKEAAAAGGEADAAPLLFIVETPSNPMQEVIDIAALAAVAKESGALLAVDNCFCAGSQQPLKHGADFVIHSLTKYVDGQGRVLGGSIAGSEALLNEKIYPFLRAGGPTLSPFNAWVASKSLETLALRVRAHSASALEIAAWLEEQPQVQEVLHTALPSHPSHALAMRQQNGLGGGLITARLKGGRAAAWRFIDHLRLFSITANFADAKSIVSHPATTTHQRMPPEARARIGLTDEIVRLSIGLEETDALKADLAQALAAL